MTTMNTLIGAGMSAGAAALFAVMAAPGAHAAPRVITLTQTGCQFVESENGIDHGYTTTKKADCEAINAKTGAERVKKAGPLTLKPGKYIFRVENKNVPYELGFWLREKGYNPSNPVDRLTRTSVSGGGLTEGKTRDYEVTLEEGGEYLYSCPLNTTPDYKIIVH